MPPPCQAATPVPLQALSALSVSGEMMLNLSDAPCCRNGELRESPQKLMMGRFPVGSSLEGSGVQC